MKCLNPMLGVCCFGSFLALLFFGVILLTNSRASLNVFQAERVGKGGVWPPKETLNFLRHHKNHLSGSSRHSEPTTSSGRRTVVGGTAVASGEFPFFVTYGLCGGTLVSIYDSPFVHEDGGTKTACWIPHLCLLLYHATFLHMQISPNRVLTAAHCIEFSVPATVRVGATTQSETDGTEYPVACAKVHPNYDCDDYDPDSNDIAVLKLATSVPDIEPVTLNTDTSLPVGGTDVTLLGFGQTSAGFYSFEVSETLQKLNYTSVSTADCQASWGFFAPRNVGVSVCAQSPNSGVSTCSAHDSLSFFIICLFS
jgi:secreted trypsin-like serine protease